ncbi:hypothetical protein HJG60_010217 [Phyllostomus discolor]|uniref:Uncharacterized protein n=1 Tax=Phyllostomus discolor TaxID=89673 RepID=A0A834EJS0_9CHIR|nr:hypothetical protein HJG60_010217 [Phyllostomus discolor]
MLIHLKLSQRLLTLSSLLWILFSSCCSNLVFFVSSCSKMLILYSPSSIPLLIPCKLFFTSVSVFFISDSSFFMVFISVFMLLKFSLSSSTLPPSSLSILISSVLNSASGTLLVSICSFSGVLVCSFIWDICLSFF